MQKTENFELNQWEKTDRIMMEDFNNDNAKLDAALGTQAASIAALTEQMTTKGNCQIYATSYAGDGGRKTLTFDKRPLGVIITGPDGSLLVLPQGMPQSYVRFAASSAFQVNINWNGNSVGWYYVKSSELGHEQMNKVGVTYYVMAFLES